MKTTKSKILAKNKVAVRKKRGKEKIIDKEGGKRVRDMRKERKIEL